MPKYMILPIFMVFLTFSLRPHSGRDKGAGHAESIKNRSKGPVLDPLRIKPYQRRMILRA